MKKRGETQEALHPSRDTHKGGYEYELPYGGNEGVNFIGMGYYEKESIEPSMAYHRDEGDTDNALLQPSQGRLFDPDKHEAANRQKLGRERFQADDDLAAEWDRNKALQDSTIPTSHLQSRPGRRETSIDSSNEGAGWAQSRAAGWYRGPATELTKDRISVDPSQGDPGNTFIHEAGHRRHLGERGMVDDLTTHPKGLNPDPLKEGVADAYVDRYGGPADRQVREMSGDIERGLPKFGSYEHTGYNASAETANAWGWSPGDRALYAASRAHASETGEQALYDPQSRHPNEVPEMARHHGGHPTTDATLHHLLTTSPHAQQALQDLGISHMGNEAVARHEARQMLYQGGQQIQGSMLTEHTAGGLVGGPPEQRAYSVDPSAAQDRGAANVEHNAVRKDLIERTGVSPEDSESHHMNLNQFGKTPVSAMTLKTRLGTPEVMGRLKGFT